MLTPAQASLNMFLMRKTIVNRAPITRYTPSRQCHLHCRSSASRHKKIEAGGKPRTAHVANQWVVGKSREATRQPLTDATRMLYELIAFDVLGHFKRCSRPML
jgi:hypothetical protein